MVDAPPPQSPRRLIRLMLILAAIGALIWIVAITGIGLSSKQSLDDRPEENRPAAAAG